MLEAAQALRADGRLEEALQMLIASRVMSADVWILRGDIQLELGRLDLATSNYSTATTLFSDNAYARRQLALCLRRLGRWDKAAEAFQGLLAHDAHRNEAHIGLGECLLRLGQPEKALPHFEECWSDSAQVQALFGKAVALQLLKRTEEAAATYEQYLHHEPGSGEALSNLIALSVEPLDLDRLDRYSLRLVELDPSSRVALQGLALSALERREYDSATGYMARLAELPRSDDVQQDGKNGGIVKYRFPPEVSDQVRRILDDLSTRGDGHRTRPSGNY